MPENKTLMDRIQKFLPNYSAEPFGIGARLNGAFGVSLTLNFLSDEYKGLPLALGVASMGVLLLE
jgi:hypothetical protein